MQARTNDPRRGCASNSSQNPFFHQHAIILGQFIQKVNILTYFLYFYTTFELCTLNFKKNGPKARFYIKHAVVGKSIILPYNTAKKKHTEPPITNKCHIACE